MDKDISKCDDEGTDNGSSSARKPNTNAIHHDSKSDKSVWSNNNHDMQSDVEETQSVTDDDEVFLVCTNRECSHPLNSEMYRIYEHPLVSTTSTFLVLISPS